MCEGYTIIIIAKAPMPYITHIYRLFGVWAPDLKASLNA